MNWLKLVYGPFEQSNMHSTLDVPRPARKEMNVLKLKSSKGLTALMYILWSLDINQFYVTL